jgi:proton-coupled amino acid transporter
VVDEYYDEKLDVRLYMVMLLPPLILINWVHNLKLLAPFSSFANVVTFVGLGITLYYVFDDIPSPAERNMTGNVVDFPLFIGTTLFALEAVGVVSPFTLRAAGSFLEGISIVDAK